MAQGQPPSMQRLARELDANGPAHAVVEVADDGMAEEGGMDTNLVGAPGAEAELHQAVMADTFADFPVGDGGTTPFFDRHDGHSFAIDGVATDRLIDHTGFGFRCAVDEAEVFALGGFGLDLRLEVEHHLVSFGDDDRTGGVFVEAMDDAGAQDSSDTRKVLAMVEQGVDEGAAVVAGGGVDDHACGFVDDDQRFVFVEDVEVDRFGFNEQGLGFGEGQLDLVAVLEDQFFGGAGFAIAEELAIGDELLQSRSR